MTKTSEVVYKVPDGKLLRVHVDYTDDTLLRVQIHGDFFLHPEDAILTLEGALGGCPIEKEEMCARMDEVLLALEAELVGANSSAIADAILIAVGKSE